MNPDGSFSSVFYKNGCYFSKHVSSIPWNTLTLSDKKVQSAQNFKNAQVIH